jgi:hypothetical protein
VCHVLSKQVHRRQQSEYTNTQNYAISALLLATRGMVDVQPGCVSAAQSKHEDKIKPGPHSSARLERLLYTQDVGGSNPSAATRGP